MRSLPAEPSTPEAVDDGTNEDLDDETGEPDPEWYPIPEWLEEVWDELEAEEDAEPASKGDFKEQDHPRDSSGEFTSGPGGGGGASGGPSRPRRKPSNVERFWSGEEALPRPAVYERFKGPAEWDGKPFSSAPTDIPSDLPASPKADEASLAEYSSQVSARPEFVAAEKAIQAPSTVETYSRGGKAEDRFKGAVYHPERIALHETIKDELWNPKAAVPEGQRPTMAIFIGLPGSGKGSHLKPLATKDREFTYINPDDVKERLPEYDGKTSSLVHEESVHVANRQLMDEAMEARHNVVIDTVGRNESKIREMLDEADGRGYDVELYYADLPLDRSLERTVHRYYKEGRYTPPDYIINGADHHPQRVYAAVKDDARIKRRVHVDTDVPRGEKARIVEDVSR